MKSDSQIQNDLMNGLKGTPYLNFLEIRVAVKNGIVTLSGQVDSYSKKFAAEKAAKRVSGVKAVAEDVQVGVLPAYRKTATEIAEAVLNALKWHIAVQEEKIKINVEDGIVILEGEVQWDFQRNNVTTSIENLPGVRAVYNFITLRPKITSSGIEQKIWAAFQRSATIDAGKITTEVTGSKVTLRGTVRSFTEKEDAEDAVWFTPGVLSVDNKLEIEELQYALDY